MQNVRKAVVKAIKEADRVRNELDAEARAICGMDITEDEAGWRFDCLNSERSLVHRIISELYDVLGNIPSR